MQHGEATTWKKTKAGSANARLALWLFAAYTPIYLVFMFLCVFNPRLMARDVGSLNLAIVYGFGMIIVAIIMAVIYNSICSKREKAEEKLEAESGKGEKTE